MVAILALTCGRPEFTVETWAHNFSNHGLAETPWIYWFDNGSTPDELRPMMQEASRYNIVYSHFETQNKGIAYALNALMRKAWNDGCRTFCTMANDIKEPDGWLLHRILASKVIERTGVVSVPVDRCARYGKKNANGYAIEEGTIIGNWLITERAYKAIGGFCMDYGTYGPLDIDYCERMKAVGVRYYYLSDLHADHIGKKEFNPPEYQAKKMESLNASWHTYKANQKLYRRGEKIHQDA